ncbi:hypothetical protein ACFQET_01365 [Levilactobacillus tangyuanensis]|uniref:MucBP domain-containing protein n=1 Tax=Levilactobacillus tangyuanensis TaxID=2486021 RepID=A0ABW1TLL9_9LACO|nr:hypothetical protein [Levilactobacillus tangyuanensis]
MVMVTLIGRGLVHAQTEQPSSLVKVGQYTASTDFLNLSAYYKTTKPIRVKVAYVPTYKTGSPIMQSLYLPAGITIAGNLTTTKRNGYLIPSLQLYLARLSTAALQNSQKPGYTLDPGAGAYDPQVTIKDMDQLAGFKRVPAPTYMPGYSHGDLFLGGAQAALSPMEPQSKSLRVTSDGYVQVMTYDPRANAGLGFYQKPLGIAKITRTAFNDPYRKLYFRQDLKGVHTQHVNKHGNEQYCLTLKNLHTPQHTNGNPFKGISGTFDSLYEVGGTKYYTFIGYDGISD